MNILFLLLIGCINGTVSFEYVPVGQRPTVSFIEKVFAVSGVAPMSFTLRSGTTTYQILGQRAVVMDVSYVFHSRVQRVVELKFRLRRDGESFLPLRPTPPETRTHGPFRSPYGKQTQDQGKARKRSALSAKFLERPA
jgi:hypothetical protein